MSIFLSAISVISLRQIMYILQVVLEEAIFAVHFRKKKNFIIRLIFALILYFVLSFAILLLLNPITTHNLFAVFLLSVGLMFLCFENQATDIIFSCLAAITVQNLAYNTGILCCMVFRVSPDINSGILSRLIQLVAFVLVNGICYFACIRNTSKADTFGDCRKALIAIAAVIFLIIYILEAYIYIIGMPYFGVVRILFAICDIMVILLLFWISERYRAEQTQKKLEDMIAMQHDQFEMSKRTLELVTMKEHDLKHLLTILRNDDTIHQSQTYHDLEEAVSRFERTIKSGNNVMDIILNEKNLICQSQGITMTYMIDPTGLDQFHTEDMAAIFGNLLDNAIRYLRTVTDPEHRLLHLQVQNTAGLMMIHVENYLEDVLGFQGGLPVTTQEDRERHGFGLKSVRYLAEKHGGAMSVTAENNRFMVDLAIPIQS